MTSIAIYIEGGGEGKDGKAHLRQGFEALLELQKQEARCRRMGWKLVLCGSRDAAFRAFQQAATTASSEIVGLLVDSEAPVASSTPTGRVAHLNQRDGWSFKGMASDPVHLMTQCMEARIVADPAALATYYGNGFRQNALPKRQELDQEPKDTVFRALASATRDTQKGSYGKIKHAGDLLRSIHPDVAAGRCAAFREFTGWLHNAIQASR